MFKKITIFICIFGYAICSFSQTENNKDSIVINKEHPLHDFKELRPIEQNPESKIASENNKFDIADVLLSINAKLIERHPHIYGDVKAESDEEVAKNWELIKLKTGNKSVLSGVPKTLPALTKAMRIQEKVIGKIKRKCGRKSMKKSVSFNMKLQMRTLKK